MTSLIIASHEGEYGINSAAAALKAGRSPLDAIEIGIKEVEMDLRARTVGFGGAPNVLGQMECDASVMRGDTLLSGSVGAIQGVKHPISAAKKVMEVLPHVLITGAGASRFGKEMGLEQFDMFSEPSREDWERWQADNQVTPAQLASHDTPLVPMMSFKTRSDLSKGTVTFIAMNDQGQIDGGVSTSGWAYKYPGRLGDSPIIGAGLYVDNRFGGASCTHTGEMTIRCSTARSVVLYMKKGASVKDACLEAAQDLRDLQGGYLGPVIIHAMHKSGEVFVATLGGDEGDLYWLWRDGMAQAQSQLAQVV